MVKMIIPFLIFVLLFCGCAAEEDVFVESSVTFSDSLLNETTASADTIPFAEPELLTVLIDPQKEDFVCVKDYLPGVLTDLKYATADNFTGQPIYDFEDVFLRYGTVMKLKAVSNELEKQGLFLKIWDGFRPVSAQFKLWEICPDPNYVANPNKGYSNHSRGFAVDLTLVDAEGREVEMPTGFDDFSAKADRDYSDCSETEKHNARLLEQVMERHGFQGYHGEWWHFNDTEKYDVEECFDPSVICRRYTREDMELLERYWDDASGILRVPAGEPVTLLGFREEYAMVEYWGYRGYLPSTGLSEK